MISVRVRIVSTQPGTPAPIEVDGFVPDVASPLAVTPVATWSISSWTVHDGRWQITHRATGLNLGGREFDTREAAMAVLVRCEPAFPAWAAVKAGVADAAMMACRYKFRVATQEVGGARKKRG